MGWVGSFKILRGFDRDGLLGDLVKKTQELDFYPINWDAL